MVHAGNGFIDQLLNALRAQMIDKCRKNPKHSVRGHQSIADDSSEGEPAMRDDGVVNLIRGQQSDEAIVLKKKERSVNEAVDVILHVIPVKEKNAVLRPANKVAPAINR